MKCNEEDVIEQMIEWTMKTLKSNGLSYPEGRVREVTRKAILSRSSNMEDMWQWFDMMVGKWRP